MSDRSVVVANAGSGKTYLLANRLARWMLEQQKRTGRAEPDRILAITFTRKAAGEIVARVLRHLAEGATLEAKREEFAKPGQIGAFGADEYAAVLREFVRALHRVSISTIDGFFVQVAGAFGPELGLPEGWTIGEDDELKAIRSEAIGAVVGSSPHRAAELAKQIGEGEPKAEVQSGIDSALGTAIAIWKRCAAGGDPVAAWGRLTDDRVQLFPGARRSGDPELDAAANGLRTASLPLTKAGTPVSNWVKASQRVARLVDERDWFGFLEDSLVQGLVAGGKFSSREPEPDFAAALAVARAHALVVVGDAMRARIRASAELAQRVDAEMERMQRAAGRYGFADLTNALAAAQSQESARGEDAEARLNAMRERLDRSIRDLAFDEFQDTSPEQWTAIAPLVDEILADGERRLLVVGDPKQSIYAWRGGTPALLAAVGRRPGLDKGQVLDVSYRSSPVVLSFVNAFFGPLATTLAGTELAPASPDAARDFASVGLVAPAGATRAPVLRALDDWTFSTHRPSGRNAALPGLVQAFRSLEQGKESVAESVAAIVAARSAARPGASIAVLVRTNEEISACVAAIRAAGLEASDEGRSPLLDSAAVATVLSLLRLASAPDDDISHWVATREPAAALLGLAPMESHGDARRARAAAPVIARDVRSAVLSHGLSAWIERTAARLFTACSRHDAERLGQLATLARSMSPDLAAAPGDFVEAVIGRGARTAAVDRIRVMTLHSSKGLEFDEVVLASMDAAMGDVKAGAGNWSVLVEHPMSPPSAVAPIVSQHLLLHSPILSAFKREAEVARFSDDISLLYVGMTRAREALHLVCSPPSGEDRPKHTGTYLMRMSMPGFDAGFGSATVGTAFWKYEDPELESVGEPGTKAAAAAAAQAAPARPAIEHRRRSTAVRAPSTHEAAPGRLFAKEFAGTDDGARGSLAHGWFERIEWLDGALPDATLEPAVVRAVSVEIRRPPDGELVAAVRALVSRACAGAIGACLSRDRYRTRWGADGESISVRSEMPFAVDGGDALVHGRMDRVVLGFRNGRVVRAEVVDWKTGATGVEGAAFEERIAGYRAQMAGYRRALCTMFGLEAEAVTAVLAFVDRGELVEIDGALAE
jgi:ATP-dependent exoDNAse (exonuclease V) beta subunit